MNDQQKASVKIKTSCSRCGKVLSRGSGGSLTSWIFKESRCRCGQTEALMGWQDADPLPEHCDDVDVPESLLNRFEVSGRLGTGGMGAVFKVIEKSTGQAFALKVMRRELAADSVASKRFMTEARAAQMISHHNVVAVNDFGLSEEGSPYILMELIEGKNLDVILSKEKVLWVNRAIDMFIQIAEGLSFAHAKNITHRDIKPSNIIVYDDASGGERIKIVDFGIAKFAGGDEPAQKLTQTGQVFGSPIYMSPEQCEGEQLDARSDIYSFGCMLYECLAGRPPFCNTTAIKTIIDHLTEKAPPIIAHNANVSKSLEQLVMHCLEKDREKRYQSMDQVISDLITLRQGGTISARADRKGAGQKVLAWSATGLAVLGLLAVLSHQLPKSINLSSSSDSSIQSAPTEKRASTGNSVASSGKPFASQVDKDKRLIVTKPDITDADMKEIASIGYLSSLSFSNNKITDEQLCLLSNMKIDSLALDSANISGTAFSSLKSAGIKALFFLYANFTPAGMTALSQLPDVDYLSVIGGNFSNADMAHVSKMPHLTEIHISSVPIADDCFNDLSKMKNLRKLILTTTGVRAKYAGKLAQLSDLGVEDSRLIDADLNAIAAAKNLQSLNLVANAGLTTKGLRALLPLKGLVLLDMSGTSIDNDAFKYLHSFPQLSSFGFSDTRVTVNGSVDALQKLPKITDITVGAPFTDATLSSLAKLTHIRRLTISRCAGISDKGILSLRAMNLNLLRVVECPNITEAGAARFREQSPNTEIRYGY